MNRATRIGLGLVALLGGFVFFMLTVGSLGEPQPDVSRVAVMDVLAVAAPAETYGSRELRISGWYAELDADCAAPAGEEARPAGWLAATCPLRVLLPYQPAESVSQAEL